MISGFEDYRQRIGDRTPAYRAVRSLLGDVRVLYPGSYLDAQPLDVWTDVVCLDTDPVYRRVVAKGQLPTRGEFLVADYREDLEVGEFDLLLSLYAGPVSVHCTRYLRVGGHLLCSNSHGDASLASLDPRYRIRAVLPRGDRLRTEDLEDFVTPRRPASRDAVVASGRGVAFRRSARYHLFRRVA